MIHPDLTELLDASDGLWLIHPHEGAIGFQSGGKTGFLRPVHLAKEFILDVFLAECLPIDIFARIAFMDYQFFRHHASLVIRDLMKANACSRL